jgi:transposase
MPRLTEVQRGHAIALLMQGQRQQQVALQFGVNVSTIERLVRRLRNTILKGLPDHPRVTTPRQDRAIHLAHLRNRHVTATETALTTVGNHNRHIHPETVRNLLRELGLRARRPYILHWFSSHSCTSRASYGLVGGTFEHLWDEMDRRVRRRRNAPANLDQLRAALLEEWDNIPMRRIHALMNSMHRRIRAVTDARGRHTTY